MDKIDELTYERPEEEEIAPDVPEGVDAPSGEDDGTADCVDAPSEDELELTRAQVEELARLYPRRVGMRKALADMTPAEVGREGEVMAAAFLLSNDFEILDTNWRCGGREADIVALDGDEVVLVEVKTRRRPAQSRRDEIPELAVDWRKQEGYRSLALLYMAFHADVRHIRFDVIAINMVVGGGSRIRHLVGAFTWDE